MTIAELMRLAHANATAHGFHEHVPAFGQTGRDVRHILSWLMLAVTELAEAAEAARVGDLENFGEECADVLIRVADTCAALEVDLQQAVARKLAKNADRPRMHGKLA